MAKLNKVFLMGNLTRDPDLKYAPSGDAIVNISIAMNRSWKGKDGETKEEVTYAEIVMFGKRAEVINQYFGKGDPIFIEGRLKFEQWETAEGKRSALKVTAEDFQFIGKMATNQTSEPVPSSSEKPYSNANNDDPDIKEEEIPF